MRSWRWSRALYLLPFLAGLGMVAVGVVAVAAAPSIYMGFVGGTISLLGIGLFVEAMLHL